MSEKCGCKNHECACKNDNKFFIGVNDITYFKAHYDVFNKEVVLTENEDYREENDFNDYHVRVFGNKFVNDPMLAVLNAIAFNSKESNDPEYRKWFMENVRYCKESKCFYIDEYLTLGVELPPKQCQWEMFFKGEYEFICVRNEIQVLETRIANFDLNTMAKSLNFNQCIEQLPDPKIEDVYEIGPNAFASWSFRYKLEDLPIKKFKI